MDIFKCIVSFLLITIISNPLRSQEIEWKGIFGGTNDDGPAYVVETPDNGFIVVGGTLSNDIDFTENNGSEDLCLFKLSSEGELQWQHTYGGGKVDRAYHIIATKDGNYLIAGHTSSDNGDVTNAYGEVDFWLLKINSEGEIIWERTYGGSASDAIQSIIELENGQLLAIGGSRSADGDLSSNYGSVDIWMIKMEQNGDVIWSRNYGGTGVDRANIVFELNENAYVIIGYVRSDDGDITINHGQSDLWVARTDSDGNIQSEWSYGGSKDETIITAIQTNDNGFLIGGRSDSSDGNVVSGQGGAWLIKLDKDFQLEWENSYGDIFMTYALGLVSKLDNTYIIGTNARKTGFEDYGLMRIDQFGEVLEAQYLGGTESETLRTAIATNDGGQLVIGHTRSDDGDVGENYGKSDFWIIKMEGSLINSTLDEGQDEFDIYPNPSTGLVHIKCENKKLDFEKITVYNFLGQVVSQVDFSNQINLNALANGTYLLKIETNAAPISKIIQIVH